MKKLLLSILVCALLSGSCTVLTTDPNAYREKYTITYESSRPTPPVTAPTSLQLCARWVPPSLSLPPDPPVLSIGCEANPDCVADSLVQYIQTLRTVMTRNRKMLEDANQKFNACMAQLNDKKSQSGVIE